MSETQCKRCDIGQSVALPSPDPRPVDRALATVSHRLREPDRRLWKPGALAASPRCGWILLIPALSAGAGRLRGAPRLEAQPCKSSAAARLPFRLLKTLTGAAACRATDSSTPRPRQTGLGPRSTSHTQRAGPRATTQRRRSTRTAASSSSATTSRSRTPRAGTRGTGHRGARWARPLPARAAGRIQRSGSTAAGTGTFSTTCIRRSRSETTRRSTLDTRTAPTGSRGPSASCSECFHL